MNGDGCSSGGESKGVYHRIDHRQNYTPERLDNQPDPIYNWRDSGGEPLTRRLPYNLNLKINRSDEAVRPPRIFSLWSVAFHVQDTSCRIGLSVKSE